MPRGGKRRGAGRPKGSKDTRGARKARAERGRIAVDEVLSPLAQEGLTPLQVMLKAMQIHVRARRWDKAAAIAKDAAPYEHPRLSATTLRADVDVRQRVVEEVVAGDGAPAAQSGCTTS
ncbi:MAG: hypothetical protein HYS12_02465 [Planctomycetes bacterium]|nr:hypothetical protein [Planctomycetota bacterium]